MEQPLDSRSAGCRSKSENGMKQLRRAHFQMQLREPEGQADAGCPLIQAIHGLQGLTPPHGVQISSCRFVFGSFLWASKEMNIIALLIQKARGRI
jgi:hypothetical protein